jgi:predicted nucleic acid-binding protein/GNAT superfamily N-acetyltransferase
LLGPNLGAGRPGEAETTYQVFLMSEMEVRVIESASGDLDQVIKLHRTNSQKLGFFPRGAFHEHSQARQILLARGEGGELLGYLLYRVAKQRASIVHLCTSPNARHKGVARSLVEHLKLLTKSLLGIGLHCRQDYDAKYVWAKFGFTALHRKTGRSRDGHELTFWWFDHGHPDLFSFAAENEDRGLKVVVDANVFFDLQGHEGRESEDSKALMADWVQASIELCVTKEMYNEVERAGDAELRKRSKAAVAAYTLLKSDDALFQQICDELKPSFPEGSVYRDDSDLRQIAYAIAGDASYFVTRDERLAERGQPLYERYGLRVLHPAELISNLDVIERETKYRPSRILGSHLQSLAVKADDVEMVVEAFRDKPKQRVNEFRRAVLHCLSTPLETEARFVRDRNQRPVILGVLRRSKDAVLEVTMLRVADHSLSATMARNFLRTTLEAATKEGRRLILVSDSGCDEVVREALVEFGFTETDGSWAKIAVRTVGDYAALRDLTGTISALGGSESLAGMSRLAIDAAVRSEDAKAAAGIESRFWPAKVIGTGLPTFIVSIRAEWAQHFFDDELASQSLFGTREELLLGIEGVYYCSPKHRNLTAPARILWYVSKGSESVGSMSIKACSRLEEVVIGKPKDVFKRFERLGVFQWKDVFQVAKNDLANDVLAFRFSMTERFCCPFSLDQLEAIGIRQPLLSPRPISDSQFATIYSHGCGLT